MKKPVQMFSTNMRVYSHAGFGQRERAAYYIGRPDGPTSNLYAVSEREAHEIMTNLPDELLEVVKAHYGLVTATKVYEAQSVTVELEKEEVKEPEDDTDIYQMSITQLRQIASQLEIKGYTKYTKEELIKKIEQVADEAE